MSTLSGSTSCQVNEVIQPESLPSKATDPNLAAPCHGNVSQLPCSVILRITCFALATGLLFGIDLGSIGGALSGLTAKLSLSTMQAEWVVSGAKCGAIFGCLLGGALMTSQGRRTTIAVACIPVVVGPLLVMLAESFEQVLAGRLLMGLAIGMASVAAPCFLSEIAPPATRGSFVGLYELAVGLGFVIAVMADYGIQETSCVDCWRYQAGLLPLLVAVPLFLATLIVPESPRWLLSHAGGSTAGLRAALDAIARLGRDGAAERIQCINDATLNGAVTAPASEPMWAVSDDDLISLWDTQHAAAGFPLLLSADAASARPDEIAATPVRPSTLETLGLTFTDVVAIVYGAKRVPVGTGRALLLALTAAILDQACASTSMLVYAQQLVSDIGVTSKGLQNVYATMVAVAKLVGVVCGLLIVNRINRRPLLAWGGFFSALAILLLSAGAACDNQGLLLAGMCSFILVFYATWGVGYWVVVTEVTAIGGSRYGAACQAAATATMFAAGWITSLTFVSVTAAGGPWALTIYAAIAGVMVPYAVFLLPEMHGLTLQECAEL